ncbi:DNA primase, partial [Chlamydia psittaci 02DC14]
ATPCQGSRKVLRKKRCPF